MPTRTFVDGTTGSINIGLSQTVTIECFGGQGGIGDRDFDGGRGGKGGGKGGYIKAEVDVSAGDTLHIRYTKGGDGKTLESDEDKDGNSISEDSASGGNSASVRLNGTSLSDRVVVAGGGGASGNFKDPFGERSEVRVGRGGAGGALQGEDGDSATEDGDTAQGGDGGTQSSGFSKGTGETGAGTIDGDGDNARIGIGGSGGAGFFGGFSGSEIFSGGIGGAAGGGGGGSNFSSGTIITNQRGVKFNNAGDPAVKVQFKTGFPISIDGNQVKEITIDGQTVSNVTIDGTTL